MKRNFFCVAGFLIGLSVGPVLHADTNVFEKSFGVNIGPLGGTTNRATVRLQLHYDDNAGSNIVKVLSSDSPIFAEMTKAIIDAWTLPDRIYGKRKNTPLTDDEGKPRYKDVIIRRVYLYSCTLKEAEAQGLGQLLKAGQLDTLEKVRASGIDTNGWAELMRQLGLEHEVR